jgi:tetratricopeptide (TPR) repeat protein
MEQATREYIESLNKTEQYLECIRACENLLEDVEESDVWFVYMEMSKAYRHLQHYKKSMKSLQDAKKHTTTEKEYIQIFWQMGLLFKHTGKKKEALKFYDKCIDYYKRNNMQKQYGDMLKNKSRLLNRPEIALEAIAVFKEGLETNENITIDLIDDAYDSLNDVFTALGDYDNALFALCNIQNEEMRTRLQEKLATNFNRKVVNI